MNPHGVKHVVVVGAGTMGHGIAQVFASCGFSVVLTDQCHDSLEYAVKKIRQSVEKLVDKGLLSEEHGGVPTILDRINITDSWDDVQEADLVLEAIIEDSSAKLSLFADLGRRFGAHTILASNTSSIALTKLAAQAPHPSRVLGMHFMNPVPLMRLVEIIRAQQTSDEVYQRTLGVVAALHKQAVTVQDAPGFVSNRILMPMINEAIFVLHEGIAKAEDIDDVMKLGMAHPMGPLRLVDLIGLDTCLSIMDVLYQDFRDSKYRACPLLVRKVQAGEWGKKVGKGFYIYA